MDFNNDGFLDLLVGERKGHFNFYTGNGDGTLHFTGYSYDTNLNEICRNFNSSGYLDDWNNDGFLDLITGGYNDEIPSGGILQVHLNTSDDLTSPIWDASVIDLTNSVCNEYRLTHQTYDLDDDGDKDLILGCEMGAVLFAENIGSANNPVFNGFEQLQCDGGDIDVMFNYDAGGRARENVTDYNSDGISDLLVGFCDGGIYMFEGYTTGISEELSSPIYINDFQLSVSEIPTVGIFTVNIMTNSSCAAEITVFDGIGRNIKQIEVSCNNGYNSFQMNITNQPAGIYLISVSNNSVSKLARLVKID